MAPASASSADPQWLSERRREARERLGEAEEPEQSADALMATLGLSEADHEHIGSIRLLPLSDTAVDALLFGSLLSLSDASVARHIAFLTHAFVLVIPPGVRLHEAIRLSWQKSGAWAASHLLVIVGEGASVCVAEELHGGGGSWSHVVEAAVGGRGSLEFLHAELADPTESLWIAQRSRIEAEGSIAWRNATIGAKDLVQDLRSTLAGEGAVSGMDWLFYARGTENMSLSARNIFEGRHGGGEIVMQGVAEDKAHVRCDGMIAIGLGGGGTDTYLTQEVLMLDTTARVDAIPGLEIKTNDVKASHSATVSRVTPEDLFYFASRGIPEREARRMFVEGFLGAMTGKMSDELLRIRILTAIENKYAGV